MTTITEDALYFDTPNDFCDHLEAVIADLEVKIKVNPIQATLVAAGQMLAALEAAAELGKRYPKPTKAEERRMSGLENRLVTLLTDAN